MPVKVKFTLWPGGRTKALTMSYDDGTIHDRRLARIFDAHGVRGAFHLNSGALGREGYLSADEVQTLFINHEVSVHTLRHPPLPDLPASLVPREILEDRKALEALVGYPVRGMSYPYGLYDERVVAMLPALGIEYARTVQSHENLDVPRNRLCWHPSCHHKSPALNDLVRRLLDTQDVRRPMLLYVWGHSYEFDREGNWDIIEEFCRSVGGREEVWYATNIEIADYLSAVESLQFSASGDVVRNPSGLSVWVLANGLPKELPAGATVSLE